MGFELIYDSSDRDLGGCFMNEANGCTGIAGSEVDDSRTNWAQ
jgi:hypothetical protein